VFARNM